MLRRHKNLFKKFISKSFVRHFIPISFNAVLILVKNLILDSGLFLKLLLFISTFHDFPNIMNISDAGSTLHDLARSNRLVRLLAFKAETRLEDVDVRKFRLYFRRVALNFVSCLAATQEVRRSVIVGYVVALVEGFLEYLVGGMLLGFVVRLIKGHLVLYDLLCCEGTRFFLPIRVEVSIQHRFFSCGR